MSRKKTQTNVPGILEGFEELERLIAVQDGFVYNRKPKNVAIAFDHLRLLAEKYRTALNEIEEAILNYKQEWIIAEPTVYVARTRDKKTDIEYFTAKTFWPLAGGKNKEVKIYLGKASDFGDDTLNIKAKELAKSKMSETLLRRRDEGDI
ncbi:MAG: hypothetical protein KKG99_03535 [Bacteroidetes bacterium]|nr:hypothetical protein [Bacteroidota bacterium]